jgi:hypothetical protein
MTPADPTLSQHANLTRDMKRLQAFVADLHEHGPWSSGWEAAGVFAQGPDSADESIGLVGAAITALERLG